MSRRERLCTAMHAVTAVPVATAINPATAVTASAARTAVPLGCTGIVYALRCSLSGNRPQVGVRLSGSAPKWERAVSGNHAAAGATRCVANRSASLLLYCHCMIVRFALFRFVSLCFALFLLFRYFFVVFARRFSALGGGAKSAAVTSKVPESMPIVCLGTSAFEYRLRGCPFLLFGAKDGSA